MESSQMRLRDRVVKGTVLNLIAVVFNQGSTLIINIIVARLLLKQVFGEYAMVQSTLLTAATLSQFATGNTAAKFIAEYRVKDPDKTGRIMGLCTLVSVIMASVGAILLLLLSPWLAENVLNAKRLAVPLMIGSGFLVFSSINGYQIGVLSGLEAFHRLAKAGIICGIIAIVVIPLGAWWGGLNGALIGLSVSAILRCIVHFKWLKSECKDKNLKPIFHNILIKEKSVIFNFALPAAISGYFSVQMIWLANSFLVRQPGGYGEMALYSAANNLRILILFLPNVINSVTLSVLNNEKSKGDISNYHRIFKNNVFYIFLVSVIGVFAVGLFGRRILMLFGRDFGDGKGILFLLLGACAFEGISIPLFQYLQSKSKIWLSLFSINIPRESFLVLASLFLVDKFGGRGLAMAVLGSTILGFIAHFSLVVYFYRKEAKTKYLLKAENKAMNK